MNFYVLVFIAFAALDSHEVIDWGHYGMYRSQKSCEITMQKIRRELPKTTLVGCLNLNPKEDLYGDQEV